MNPEWQTRKSQAGTTQCNAKDMYEGKTENMPTWQSMPRESMSDEPKTKQNCMRCETLPVKQLQRCGCSAFEVKQNIGVLLPITEAST